MNPVNATTLYVSASRAVLQCDPRQPHTFSDMYTLLPFFRQSLACLVCGKQPDLWVYNSNATMLHNTKLMLAYQCFLAAKLVSLHSNEWVFHNLIIHIDSSVRGCAATDTTCAHRHHGVPGNWGRAPVICPPVKTDDSFVVVSAAGPCVPYSCFIYSALHSLWNINSGTADI